MVRFTSRVVLISPYELGRQSFGLASPAAWLRRTGALVECIDLSIERLDEEIIRNADLVAFHLPMHTATRIAVHATKRVLKINPGVHLCYYGLYAPLNETLLTELGGHTILGGEFEDGLEDLVVRMSEGAPVTRSTSISLSRQKFIVPDREGLPALDRYAHVVMPDGLKRVTGYTEASRGCKYLCRHCPVVPVYGGQFRVVQKEIVLEDIRKQVAMGARHVTFGDPDFFNGPGHVIEICRKLKEEHPDLTYDVTIKVEHLIKYEPLLETLSVTGCLFVTSAVESLDDRVLEIMDKGHTRADVIRAIELTRRAGLVLQPTFVPFTPWQTPEGYRDLLGFIEEMDLVEETAPVQLALRLLIPAGSRLLELEEVSGSVEPFDPETLVHPWLHGDPQVDSLQRRVMSIVAENHGDRRESFGLVSELAGREPVGLSPTARAAVPYLNEPWYC